MAEVLLQHDAQSLSGARAPRSHLNRRGHQFAHRSQLRIHMAERHLSQYVSFGKNPRNPKLAVDHRDRTHMVVQHLMNGIRYGGFQTHRRNLPITKIQHAHQYLLQHPSADSTRGWDCAIMLTPARMSRKLEQINRLV